MLAAILLLACWGPRACAQVLPAQAILYEGYNDAAGQLVEQLGALNPDGTGDHAVAVNLPETGYPTWSRDGRLLALSSVNPATPFSISRNVFVVDLQTAQITQVTSFADTVNGGGGGGGSAVVSACVLPWFKAFSPDRTRLAVAGVVFTGINVSATNNNPNAPYDLYSGFQGTPALQVYNLDGTPGPLVHADSSGSDTIHGGDGVDWSPTQNLLVYPADTTVPVNNYGQILQIPVTALVLMAPVNDAIGSGQASQLTFPQASANQTWSGPVTTYETDYQPAFSPDGKQVAYLRAENVMAGTSPELPTITLRLVNVDGSNDHQIGAFQQGTYCSHVSWSPDGAKLVFDAGQEVVSGGIPMPFANPTTTSLLIANADGSAVTPLRQPAAAWPAWYPGPGGGNGPPRLDLALVPHAGGPQLIPSWPAGNGNFALQSSAALGPQAAWKPEPAQPSIAGGRASLTLNASGAARFYRLVQQ